MKEKRDNQHTTERALLKGGGTSLAIHRMLIFNLGDGKRTRGVYTVYIPCVY